MTTKEMHYDFKLKLNKLDSQNKRNFEVPEIDFILNQAAEIFVKIVAQPRYKNLLGFETSQRNIDDIRTLVITPDYTKNSGDGIITVIDNIVTLPSNYMFYLRSRVKMKKDKCNTRLCTVFIRQHDDLFEESEFHKSSFEWKFVNALFVKEGIRLFPDGIINLMYLSYIKKLDYFHNAEDFSINGYKNFNNIVVTGQKNCELPDQTHNEIVDIAVMLASGAINAPDFNLKQYSMNLNQLI